MNKSNEGTARKSGCCPTNAIFPKGSLHVTESQTAKACFLGAISGIHAWIEPKIYNILPYYSSELHTYAWNTKTSALLKFFQLGAGA